MESVGVNSCWRLMRRTKLEWPTSSRGWLVNLRTLYVIAAVLLFFGAACSVRAQDVLTQGKVLRGLAKSWNANLSDWGVHDDPCVANWTGITCDATNTKVVVVRLVNKTLSGPIAKEIGQLVFLEQLDLTNNSIRDAIPAEIGQLKHLRILTLDGNKLTSPLPETLLSCNLTELAMHSNQLDGKLPTWIGQMVQLTKLDMYTNFFWGGLPPEYGRLRNLQKLELWENQLSGFIPNEWRGMTSIVSLLLGHNYLSGPLPEWLFEIPTLRTMNIPRNQFMGSFPNLTSLLRNGKSNFIKLGMNCNFFKGLYPQQYYDTLPPGVNISIQYYSNCFDNETDTNPTINRMPNATENTPVNCSRIWDCNSFYQQAALNPGGCAPCPSTQSLIDATNCICGKDQPNKEIFPVGAVVGGVVGGVCAIISALVLLVIYYKKSTRVKYPDFGRTYEGSDEPWIVPKELRRFKLQELEKATNNFDEKCYAGSGGFGKVYRGVLVDGTVVALKCASKNSTQGQTQFRNELNLLSRLHHRNLVQLEGFCDDDGLQILVYEFMENGDLRDNLFCKNGKLPLTSTQRFEAVLGIARGLDYLHSFAIPPVIHRDIKLSNVLLNHSMMAKLSDFGVSRMTAEMATHVSTAPIGTRGYVDPDYFRTNQLTTASDVYAFGIVVLEIITGLPVIDFTRLDAAALDAWAQPRFNQGGIRAIVDRKMELGYNKDLYTDMASLAFRCVEHDRLQRPTMKEVLTILEPYAKMMSDTPTHHRIEWSISHFKDKSLFEAESPMTFGTTDSTGASSQSYGTETERFTPGPRTGTSLGPGISECFTDLLPR